MGKSVLNLVITKKDIELAKKRLEYESDPIKFMEECIKIPTPGGHQIIKLYEPQKRIVRSFLENHNIIMLKSRQVGMSTICQAIITYLFTFYKNCVVGIVSREADEASDFCRKVEDMIDNLPDWIRPEYKNKRFKYFILKNGCKLYSAAVSPANPSSVFRSKSITLLIIDEAAHIRCIDKAWTGIASTVSKAQIEAQKKNIPYGTIILSTPNMTQGVGKWFYDMWISAKEGLNSFKPHSIHWTEIPDFVNDPEWYKKQCMLLNNDKRKIAQELEMQFINSEESLFEENVQFELQKLVNRTITYPSLVVPDVYSSNNKILFFTDDIPDKNRFYLIGVDVATPAGKDYSAIEVLDYETGNQVMEYSGKPDPKELFKILKFITAVLPNNMIIVENTGGFGQSLIYDLLYDEYNYNLYMSIRDTDNKQIPGFSVNARTRPLLLDAMYTHVISKPSSIKSQLLSIELLNLINKNNRIEANKGYHDDLVMAFSLCCYVRKYERDMFRNLVIEEDYSSFDENKEIVDKILDLNFPERISIREELFRNKLKPILVNHRGEIVEDFDEDEYYFSY